LAIGRAVTLLRHVPWLGSTNLFYWGDLTWKGLKILSHCEHCIQGLSQLHDE